MGPRFLDDKSLSTPYLNFTYRVGGMVYFLMWDCNEDRVVGREDLELEEG